MKSQYIKRTLSKDYANRKLSGVCAGIATHYDLPTWGVRAGAIVLGLTFTGAAVIGYLLATVILPTRHYS